VTTADAPGLRRVRLGYCRADECDRESGGAVDKENEKTWFTKRKEKRFVFSLFFSL
jgi:hypothetical protein